MKRTVMAALAAIMTIGAVAPASAWTYQHCTEEAQWIDFFVSNDKIAKECHAWIVGQGVVSKGLNEGQQWQYAFPSYHYVDATSQNAKIKVTGKKATLYAKGKETIRTKKMAISDLTGWLNKTHLKLIKTEDVHVNENGHQSVIKAEKDIYRLDNK